MGNYDSENTTILATHEQVGGNTRMLLLHKCESGRLEYVIGSYFTVECNLGDPFDMNGPAFVDDYSWDWGHYFGLFEQAALYWLSEVIGITVQANSSS